MSAGPPRPRPVPGPLRSVGLDRFRLGLLVEETLPVERPPFGDHLPSIAGFLHEHYGRLDREHLGVLLFDVHEDLIGVHIAHVGRLGRVQVDPASVFVPALIANAASVVVFHNHPSGDPRPTEEDRRFTGRLEEIGRILGVPLRDHVVIGAPPSYVGLKSGKEFPPRRRG